MWSNAHFIFCSPFQNLRLGEHDLTVGRAQRHAVDSTAAIVLALFVGIAVVLLAAGTHSMSIATYVQDVRFPGGAAVAVFSWAAGFAPPEMYKAVFPSTMNSTPSSTSAPNNTPTDGRYFAVESESDGRSENDRLREQLADALAQNALLRSTKNITPTDDKSEERAQRSKAERDAAVKVKLNSQAAPQPDVVPDEWHEQAC